MLIRFQLVLNGLLIRFSIDFKGTVIKVQLVLKGILLKFQLPLTVFYIRFKSVLKRILIRFQERNSFSMEFKRSLKDASLNCVSNSISIAPNWISISNGLLSN